MNLAMNIMGKIKRAGILMAAASLLVLTACSKEKSQNINESDILTQKPVEEGRTPITIMVKYAFTINSFEKAVEEKFPDIDIVQVGNYTGEMGIDEYRRRLKNDDLTDIVMTWPLDVGQEYWKDRLLDLSGYDFAGRYKISELNKISNDGELYYLPGPAQVRGIVYNKTLFEENNWQVPGNYDEFIELCKTIEKTGMRSIQLGFKNEEVLDTAFIGYNFGSSFSKPEDLQWIDDYNNGIGSFGDHFGTALDVFQNMIDEGIWKASDLDVDYAKREYMLFNRQCAMLEDSVLMARMGFDKTGTDDEFALMPFFNPDEKSDWARIYMVCYVGVNKHLAEPENKEKYDLAIKLMDYISTPEGQEAMSADTGAMFSCLNGVEPPNVPEVEKLIPALSQGRYAIFNEFKNAQGALRDGLAGMIKGEATKEDVIAMVDQNNLLAETESAITMLGTSTQDFSMIETGNFVTDAMREWSDCDAALFLDNGKDGQYNGKGLSGRLYKGDVSDVDISCILPDFKRGETGTLWKVTMTGEDLIKTLEHAIVVDNEKEGWFYYFSGLSMEFDPLAEPGSRIKKIEMSDGTKIDDSKEYTIAVMDESIPDSYIINCEKTDVTISDILKEAIEEKVTISPSSDGRFQIVQ